MSDIITIVCLLLGIAALGGLAGAILHWSASDIGQR